MLLMLRNAIALVEMEENVLGGPGPIPVHNPQSRHIFLLPHLLGIHLILAFH